MYFYFYFKILLEIVNFRKRTVNNLKVNLVNDILASVAHSKVQIKLSTKYMMSFNE